MRLSTRLKASLLVVVWFVACAHAPQQQPRLFPNTFVGPDMLARRSSMIIVGRVTNVRSMPSPQRATINGQTIHLLRETIDISVELTLKGQVQSKTIVVSRYAWKPTEPGSQLLNVLNPRYFEPGDHCLFFLESDGDYIRTAADITRTHIGLIESDFSSFVPTGRPERDIASLLLTPPTGSTRYSFVQSLNTAAFDAEQVSGADWTLKLLRKLLLDSPSKVIRSEACVVIGRRFSGQHSCFQHILPADAPEEDKQNWRQLSTHYSAMDSEVKEEFIKSPDEYLMKDRQSAFTRCNDLGILSVFEDDDVRRVASSMLDKEFPDYGTLGCALP
jgi:hypothetical protein